MGFGGGELKPDIHFNPLWRGSLPGTVCLLCLGLLSHPVPMNTAGLPWPRQILLQLLSFNVPSQRSHASHPHFDLYLISDPLAPPGAQMGK